MNGIVDAVLSLVSAGLVIGGLIGQAFEMKKIRASIRTDEELNPKNIFGDRRNFKWYGVIIAGMIVWYAAGAKF